MSERQYCHRCGWAIQPHPSGPITALREHWVNDHNGVPKVRVFETDNPKGEWRELK